MYAYKMMKNHRVYTVHSINIYTVCFVKEGGSWKKEYSLYACIKTENYGWSLTLENNYIQ